MRAIMMLLLSLATVSLATPPTIGSILLNGQNLPFFATKLRPLLVKVGLASALDAPGPFTLFVPSDNAFENAALGNLTSEKLLDILTYHLVTGAAIYSTDLQSSQTVNMTNGVNTTVTENNGAVRINDYANVVFPDVAASNGVIHIIDHVLVPPCGNKFRFGTFFDAIDIAESVPELSDLLLLLKQTGLEKVFRMNAPGPSGADDGSYTIFAPSNAAFQAAKLPSDPAAVAAVLEFHVVPRRILSTDLAPAQYVTTLNGEKLLVVNENGRVTVLGQGNVNAIHANDSAFPPVDPPVVRTADVQACNAVIHVVDHVLLPSAHVRR